MSALPLERTGRTRIVISEYEFPTVGQIAHAQELRGAEVVHVRPGADGSIPPEQRKALGIDDTLVRLSVGVEDLEDLRTDLADALDKI